MDQNLNSLLKWSVENSSTTSNDPDATRPSNRGLSAEALSALLGGPSDADLMKESMSAILSPSVPLSEKLVAFDNFEQLIENLDNANNIVPLGLWDPLLSCLKSEEPDIVRMAAWCVGTSVQNNEKSQKAMLEAGGVVPLVDIALDEKRGKEVRRKAIYALSSEIRNFQPGTDLLVEELEKRGRPRFGKVDAEDMDAIDTIINGLREDAAKGI